MKLSYKIYSLFFIIAILFGVHSCDKHEQKKLFRNALNVEDSIALSNSNKRAEELMRAQIYDSAFYYFNKSRKLQIIANDSLGVGYSILCMAETQKSAGDYFGCEETATEALPFLENLHYKKENIELRAYQNYYLSKAYNLLGVCYKNLPDVERAINLYNKAKSITKDPLAKCILENNKASVYIENGEYIKAYNILSNLITSDVVLNSSKDKSMVLNNLGNTANKLHKPEALGYLESSLNIRTLNKDLSGITSSYIQLAEFHSSKNKINAIAYAKKADSLATRLKNSDKRIEALRILIALSRNKENYALKYIQINDSLQEARLKTKSEFASIKYESATKEKEILQLKAKDAQNLLQAQKDASSKLLLKIAIVCALIISAFIIYILRQRHKKAKIREVYNTENRISKQIHDELANDVFNVMSFAESQNIANPGQNKLLHDLDVIYQKTRDISRENNTIDTGENFGNVLREMLADYKTSNTNVIIISFDSIAWNEIADHKKITAYRVLQELMVNMKKHSQADVVAIKFSCEHKKITIHYKDNGKGLGNDKLLYKNGLKNAENRISAINGSLIFDTSTTGLKVICTFPA